MLKETRSRNYDNILAQFHKIETCFFLKKKQDFSENEWRIYTQWREKTENHEREYFKIKAHWYRTVVFVEMGQ